MWPVGGVGDEEGSVGAATGRGLHGGWRSLCGGDKEGTRRWRAPALRWAPAPRRVPAVNSSLAQQLFRRVRILCWVMTAPGTLHTKARHVRATWARHCNVALFMSSRPDPGFPAVGLPVGEGRQQLYWKTIRAFQYVHRHHLGQADWFLKADDDTFVVVANLRWLLAAHSPERPVYFGKRFRPFARQGYMSGGAGYVLSREALRRFVGAVASGTCGHSGPVEDLALGQCLEKLGVEAGDSRDTRGRETFHPFAPETHLTRPLPRDPFYPQYSYYPVQWVSETPLGEPSCVCAPPPCPGGTPQVPAAPTNPSPAPESCHRPPAPPPGVSDAALVPPHLCCITDPHLWHPPAPL